MVVGCIRNADTTIIARLDRSEGDSCHLTDISIGTDLSPNQKACVKDLVESYKDVFSLNPRKPKINNILNHKIITNDALTVKQRMYRTPKAWEEEIEYQVKEMLDNGIISPSSSPWNAPIILVKKGRYSPFCMRF